MEIKDTLASLKELEGKASKGPWSKVNAIISIGDYSDNFTYNEDNELLLALRNAFPAILEYIGSLETQSEKQHEYVSKLALEVEDFNRLKSEWFVAAQVANGEIDRLSELNEKHEAVIAVYEEMMDGVKGMLSYKDPSDDDEREQWWRNQRDALIAATESKLAGLDK